MNIQARIINALLNFLFFGTVVLIVIGITTLAFTKKINENRREYLKAIPVSVQKNTTNVLSLREGIVNEVLVQPGEQVQEGQPLIELDDPVLRQRVQALYSIEDNVSAQAEARIAQTELTYLTIESPISGVVGEILVDKGEPIDNGAQVMNLFSNENVYLLAKLSNEEYHEARKMSEIIVYSPRLDQTFKSEPESLQPFVSDPDPDDENDEKRIGLLLSFKNASDGANLIHNEDLELQLRVNEDFVYKPIDYFVDFWNNTLGIEQ